MSRVFLATEKSLRRQVVGALSEAGEEMRRGEGFRRPFRDVTIELFERTGHTPQLEEADEFDRRVLAWLGRK